MKQLACYVCGSPDAWSIYALNERQDTDAATEPLAEALDTQGILQRISAFSRDVEKQGSVHVVIGLPAAWCLSATISDTGIPRGAAAEVDQALSYRLEAALPITAEDCAIGFVGCDSDRLGVATQAHCLKTLVQTLEDQGHVVSSITPRALLAAQAWCDAGPVDQGEWPATLCWREAGSDHAGSAQLLHIDPARPPRWRVIAGSAPDPLREHLMIDGLLDTAAGRQWFVTADIKEMAVLPLEEDVPVQSLGDPVSAECDAARKIVQRPDQAWVNLAKGPLAPRYQWRRIRQPAIAATAAAMLLLAAIAAVLLLRAEQYNLIARQYDNRSAEAFAHAMPGQTVPVSPKRRLQTRLKQLQGESGIAGGEELQITATPTLNVLHDLLITLPGNQRYAITDLRLEDGGLRMSGYARSHGEADQLANALRKAGVFVVEPPSTDKLPDGGVRFSLKGQHSRPVNHPEEGREGPPSSDPAKPSLAERTGSGAGR